MAATSISSSLPSSDVPVRTNHRHHAGRRSTPRSTCVSGGLRPGLRRSWRPRQPYPGDREGLRTTDIATVVVKTSGLIQLKRPRPPRSRTRRTPAARPPRSPPTSPTQYLAAGDCRFANPSSRLLAGLVAASDHAPDHHPAGHGASGRGDERPSAGPNHYEKDRERPEGSTKPHMRVLHRFPSRICRRG